MKGRVTFVAEVSPSLVSAIAFDCSNAFSRAAGSTLAGQCAWMSVAGYFARTMRVSFVVSAGVGSYGLRTVSPTKIAGPIGGS